MPGIVDRFTRGTYGMGIIKTEDGGPTWKQILPLTQTSYLEYKTSSLIL
ncbi:MAG: hypothetical protein IPP42_15370 [Saprospiraceae bacterium]|nr:hypothetical protein [Saprospiraceae bacterium]